MMSQAHDFGRGNMLTWGGLVVGMMIVGVLLGAEQPLFGQEQSGTAGEYVKKLGAKDARVRDKAVDAILRDRKLIVEKLIALADPVNAKKQTYETRAAAAFVLGELRAVKAVPVLSKAMPEVGDRVHSEISRFSVPFWNALVKIGRPAVPVMIENIETSDNRILRIDSLGVLNHVLGGKRRLLELLAKLETRAAKDKRKQQRIQAAATWAKKHYKETEEPLY